MSTWSLAAAADTPYVLYDMAEVAGAVMNDQSGNGRNGTYVGSPTLGSTMIVPGTSATSVLFPGTSGVYATSAVAGWTSTATYSFEIIGRWVSLKGAGIPNGLWQFGAETNSMVRVSDSGLRAGRLNGRTSNVQYPDPGSVNDVSAGVAYHIVETCDGTTKRLYLNGALIASVGATTAIASGTMNVPWNFANGRESNMHVAGIAIYRTVLSQANITAHYLAAFNPFQDNFANAGAIPGNLSVTGIDTTSWTTEVSEPGGMSHTGWATFTPSTAGVFTLSTVGSDFDTMLAVYTGTALNNLVLVASDDNSGGSNTSLINSLALSAGTTYYIQVGAQAAGSGGLLSFSLTQRAGVRAGAVTAEAVMSGTPVMRLGASGIEVVTNAASTGGIPSRRLGAVSVEVLVPRRSNFIGWGLPQ